MKWVKLPLANSAKSSKSIKDGVTQKRTKERKPTCVVPTSNGKIIITFCSMLHIIGIDYLLIDKFFLGFVSPVYLIWRTHPFFLHPYNSIYIGMINISECLFLVCVTIAIIEMREFSKGFLERGMVPIIPKKREGPRNKSTVKKPNMLTWATRTSLA